MNLFEQQPEVKTNFHFRVTFYNYNSGASDNGFTSHTLYYGDLNEAIEYHKKCKQWELESNNGRDTIDTDRDSYEDFLNQYVWYDGYLSFVGDLMSTSSVSISETIKIDYND